MPLPSIQRTQLLLFGFQMVFCWKSKYSEMYQFMKERSCIQMSLLRWISIHLTNESVHEGKKLYSNVIIMKKAFLYK